MLKLVLYLLTSIQKRIKVHNLFQLETFYMILEAGLYASRLQQHEKENFTIFLIVLESI